jgi:hypothetical protein
MHTCYLHTVYSPLQEQCWKETATAAHGMFATGTQFPEKRRMMHHRAAALNAAAMET